MRISRHLALKLRLIVALVAVVGALLACSVDSNGNVSASTSTVNVPISGVHSFIIRSGTIDPNHDCQPDLPPALETLTMSDEVAVGFHHWRSPADNGACTLEIDWVYRGYFQFDLSSLINLLAPAGTPTPSSTPSGGIYSLASLEFDVVSPSASTGAPLCAKDIEFVRANWSAGQPDPSQIMPPPPPAFPTTSQLSGSNNQTVNMSLPSSLPVSSSVTLNNGALQVTPQGHFTMNITDVVRAWLPAGGLTDGRNLPNVGLAFTSTDESAADPNNLYVGDTKCVTHFANFKLTVTLIS